MANGVSAFNELLKLHDAYADIWAEVFNQLERQVDKWGIQDHDDGTQEEGIDWELMAQYAKENCEEARDEGRLTWSLIIDEEIAEALAEAPGSDELRTELIQVAAVAIAWIENIDRRKARDTAVEP